MDFLIKVILFTLKIYFFTMTYAQSFENQFFSNIFTFLNVILQYFEYNLKFFANFHIKTQTSTDSGHTFTKNYRFWGIF